MNEGQALSQLLARTDLALIAIAFLMRATKNENLLLAVSAAAQAHRANAVEEGAPEEVLVAFDETLGNLLLLARGQP